MQLNSSAFRNNQPIPDLYTCLGGNVNPPLQISSVPAKAKSLSLIVHDPDSPSGNFIHWTVWNIDPTTEQIIRGQAPSGAYEGLNDFGERGYGGPCPHKGNHRYIFTLYAYDRLLDIPNQTKPVEIQKILAINTLAETSLTGTFAAR